MTPESLEKLVSRLAIALLFLSVPFVSFEADSLDWSSPTQISHGAWESGSAYMVPYVAVDGWNVYAVWMDGRENLNLDYDLHFASSSDGGTTWQTDKRIDTRGVYASNPKIVANGTELHAVLEESNTFWHVYSADGGTTWQNESIVSRGNMVEKFDLALEGSNLYLVWSEWNTSEDSYELFLVNSSDLGGTWSTPTFIVNVTENHAYIGLDASEGWLHVVNDGGYIRSSDAGNTWGPLDESLKGVFIRADGPYVHLMRGNSYYLDGYVMSEDFGNTWSPVNTSVKGKISSAGEYLYVVNGSEHFFSSNRGLVFDESGIIPDISPISPYCASVAVDETGRAHVVYVEYVISDGHIEIFYVRSDTPQTVPTLPGAPQNLVATASNQEVTLGWEAPLSDGGLPVTNYLVYRGTSSGGEIFLIEIGNITTYVDSGLTNGQTYFYEVSAKNSVDEGPKSNEANCTPATVPGPPTSLVTEAGNGQVTLTWTLPLDDGGRPITNYSVYKGMIQGEESFLLMIGDVLRYTDNDVINGVTYWYLVTAMNSVGEGSNSTEASATPTNQHPVCSIESPTDGAVVSGVLAISGTADDSDGTVEKVEIRINDYSWIVVTGAESWNFDWNSTGVSDGNHTIYARSYDGESYSSEVNVSVVVDNYIPQPPLEEESIFIQAWFWAVVIAVIVLLSVLFILLWKRRESEEK